MKNAPQALRRLLARPGIVRTLAAHDVLTSLVLEEAGFEMTFLGGFGLSASAHGLPDLDFLGITDMADAVRRMARRLSIPVIADGDTGHGGPLQVARTLAEIEAAGAAGIILEDQESPKRCGHFDGKRVIPASDMLEKWKAALGARSDPHFYLVARTDALATHGLDEAIDRANRYCEAGADMAFVEAPLSRPDLEAIAERVRYPKLANMLSFGKTPILPAAELEQMGFKVVVGPIETILASVAAVRRLARAFLRDGHARGLEGEMATFDEVKRLLGLKELPNEK